MRLQESSGDSNGNGKAAFSRRWGKRFLKAAKFVLLIGILVAVGLLSALVGMRMALSVSDVSVPEILGKDRQQAEALLQASKLGIEVVASRYDSQVPNDAIVSQSPAPGGSIKEGRKVRVVLSLGARKHPVPSLVGATLRVARAKLLQSEYELGAVSEMLRPGPAPSGAPSDGAAEGPEEAVVLQQHPAAGTEESGGVSVDLLVVRRAPAGFIMPDLVGKTLSQTYALFDQKGFRLGSVRYRPAPGKPLGTVLRQYPEPGSKLKETDEIHVEVAS